MCLLLGLTRDDLQARPRCRSRGPQPPSSTPTSLPVRTTGVAPAETAGSSQCGNTGVGRGCRPTLSRWAPRPPRRQAHNGKGSPHCGSMSSGTSPGSSSNHATIGTSFSAVSATSPTLRNARGGKQLRITVFAFPGYRAPPRNDSDRRATDGVPPQLTGIARRQQRRLLGCRRLCVDRGAVPHDRSCSARVITRLLRRRGTGQRQAGRDSSSHSTRSVMSLAPRTHCAGELLGSEARLGGTACHKGGSSARRRTPRARPTLRAPLLLDQQAEPGLPRWRGIFNPGLDPNATR